MLDDSQEVFTLRLNASETSTHPIEIHTEYYCLLFLMQFKNKFVVFQKIFRFPGWLKFPALLFLRPESSQRQRRSLSSAALAGTSSLTSASSPVSKDTPFPGNATQNRFEQFGADCEIYLTLALDLVYSKLNWLSTWTL